MTPPLLLQTFEFENRSIQLYVPDQFFVQQIFQQKIKQHPLTPTPYWSQVWPAAISLAEYLEKHSHLIKNKNVLELAAGLGLPSFAAAVYAKEICCSDYLQEPLDVINQTIAYNQFNNITTSLLDWNNLPNEIMADILLLSDINYELASFETLFTVLQRFIEQDTTVILSTPQRIIAKPFIQQLMPWCIEQEEMVHDNVLTMIMVLKKKIM